MVAFLTSMFRGRGGKKSAQLQNPPVMSRPPPARGRRNQRPARRSRQPPQPRIVHSPPLLHREGSNHGQSLHLARFPSSHRVPLAVPVQKLVLLLHRASLLRRRRLAWLLGSTAPFPISFLFFFFLFLPSFLIQSLLRDCYLYVIPRHEFAEEFLGQFLPFAGSIISLHLGPHVRQARRGGRRLALDEHEEPLLAGDMGLPRPLALLQLEQGRRVAEFGVLAAANHRLTRQFLGAARAAPQRSSENPAATESSRAAAPRLRRPSVAEPRLSATRELGTGLCAGSRTPPDQRR